MSWNKNTVNYSEIDTCMGFLKEFGIPFKIQLLGMVKGCGLNDDPEKEHPMRRLVYKDKVLIEQIHRTNDCDTDDTIISRKFNKSDEPKDWKIEVMETNE